MALNEPRPDIKPKMTACLIDITEHCSPDFAERCGGKVYMSGFFDDNLNTYCCSTTPSIWVEVIGLVPERYPEEEPAREELWSALEDARTEDDSCYIARSAVERMRREHPDHFRDLDLTFDEDEDPMEETLEHLQGTPCF